MPARVAVTIALLALAAAAPAHAAGGDKPTGQELWRAYPLQPDASATAAATTSPAPSAARTPARAPANDGGGGAGLPIALAGLAAAAGATGLAVHRRRRTPAATPAPAAPPPAPAVPTRAAERLRAAVDMRLSREWPWPEGSDALWRCEIAPDPGALSARFRAVVHPPDGEPARVLAVSAAGPAAGDWQSAEPLEQAVNALAAQLEAEGWDAVEGGGDPYTRRFCWRRDGAPHARLKETAWSA